VVSDWRATAAGPTTRAAEGNQADGLCPPAARASFRPPLFDFFGHMDSVAPEKQRGAAGVTDGGGGQVQDKTNPKKETPGKGWRAGSPMASAAKPKDPVHIGLNRCPPS
jgi:hypothetical protein